MNSNYISNLLKNLKQEDTQKFIFSNQAKNFWINSFGNELLVDWEKFKNHFEKALNEINFDKEDLFECFLFLRHKLEVDGKVNVISFGQLFNSEDSFKEICEKVKFETHLELNQNKGEEKLTMKGINTYFGIGESKNEEKSKEIFISESKNGNKLAEAITYLKGWNEKGKDLEKAINLLSSVYFEDQNFSSEESSFAVYFLSTMYEKGEGTEKSEKKRRVLLELASTKNNVVAQYEIGKLYEKGEQQKEKEKVYEKNINKAIEYFEKSARGGYSLGFYEMAFYFEKGAGQEFPVDIDSSLFLYERASQLGVVDASFRLGLLYLNAPEGVEKNIPKALSFLTIASNKGLAEATEKLKQLSEEGVKLVDHLEEGIKKCIQEGKCTRVATDKSYEEQCYYDCFTCGIKGGKGVCETCKDVCHKGHEIGEMKFGGFFCDCVDNFKDCIYQPEPEIEDLSGKHFENLFGENIISKEKEVKPTQETLNDLVVGVYFSAHWCGPCRKFSPKLVNLYEEINKDGKKMEIVFVSSDQSSEKMIDYMNEVKMPWLAVPFDSPNVKELKKKFKVNGIPHLVILNKKGKKVSEDGYGDLLNLGNKAFEEKWSK